MSTAQALVPPAELWIEEIEKDLQYDPDSRTIIVIARTLLLLLSARSMPDFVFIPVKVFAQLAEVYDLDPLMYMGLATTASCFDQLNDATAATIQEYLRGLLAENTPQDSLRAYLAGAFNVICVDTDPVSKGMGNPSLMGLLLSMSLGNVDAIEDFMVKTTEAVSNQKVSETIQDFYAARGFSVYPASPCSNFVSAEKDDQSLTAGYTNCSNQPDGYILVTVKGR